MPWLASTAFLHSVMVQEKKNMLRVWNAVLVSLAFCLSLFGTFLTRSGVISSIHSFTQSSIGPWLLGYIAVVAAFSTALIFWRLPLLRTKTRLESLASREAAFLYNNLLLVALTLTVLWGVAFPLLSELVRGEKIRIGPPYFDFFLRVLGLPLLLLMGDELRRLAAHLVTRAGHKPDRAGGVRARLRDRAGRARRGLEQGRPRRVHLLRVCARCDRARVHPRNPGEASARPLQLAGCILVTRRPQPPPLRRLHRACGDRPARARDRRRRVRLDQGAEARARPNDEDRRLQPALPRLGRSQRAKPHRDPRPLAVSRRGHSLGTYLAGKNSYPVEDRSRTRSGSAPTGCARRTCS